jgi:hypothetical protein
MTFVKEKWTQTGRRMISEIDTPSPSCLKCDHFGICKIAAYIFPFMEGAFPDKDNRPFTAEEIAKICRFYEHKLDNEEEEDDGR